MQMKYRGIRRAMMGMVSGVSLLAIGACTVDDIQAQFANGLSTALTGLFRIGAQTLAENIFGVN